MEDQNVQEVIKLVVVFLNMIYIFITANLLNYRDILFLMAKKKPIRGPALYKIVEKSGVFDHVEYLSNRPGQPGVYFEVYRNGCQAFLNWHSDPVQHGYDWENGPSRISQLSVSKNDRHLMWYETDSSRPQVKPLQEADASDPVVKQFLEDIIAQFK